jgi:hypothetical protein
MIVQRKQPVQADPLHQHAYYVFPELINLKRPVEDDARRVEDGVASAKRAG